MRKEELKNFKKGDKVVMHSCHEASLPEYKGKVWTCFTDSKPTKWDGEVVWLEGFSGSFYCEYLQIVKQE